ncbi:hypothetical protein N7539_008604 [Penicillium diatomitis]|uniref:Uncharacterized protein n=1 Tax=Penicillium diatomitis TaxID=2819901 RepID=A0A9W9WQX1_9EURO|nr:uncharacterized protein N7539_008604 [Penicillium diatomitis]KAJ5472035.1 hypothetical protein N7539_008604 [Penicillium diatomitis]
MEGHFECSILSATVTFQVGPAHDQITVDSAALAKLSKPLETLINNVVIDAKRKCIEWSKVLEVAETKKVSNDYSTGTFWVEEEDEFSFESAATAENERKPLGEVPNSEPPTNVILSGESEIADKKQSVSIRQLRDTSINPHPGSLGMRECPRCKLTAPRHSGPWEDFTPVFVDQARLYVLADTYDIVSLRSLVLPKLHATLKTFT